MTIDEALQLVADGDIHFDDLEDFSSHANKRYQTCDSFYSGEYGEMRRKLAGYLVGRLPK